MSGTRSRQPGELERSVMSVLWRTGPLSASEVRRTLPEPAPAITTVLTVLDRLRAKGLVTRDDEGSSLVFSAAVSESDHTASAMLAALESSDDRGAALVRFAGDLTASEVAMLRAALDSRD